MQATTPRSGRLLARSGLRPLVCVRRAPLRIAATAVPVQHAAASAGNGTAAPAPQLPQQSAAVPVTVTAPVPSVLPPAMVYETASNLGAAKAAMPFGKTLLLGVLAGVYVGLCAALLMTVGPNCPGIAQANPVVCGAELFTGNTALLPVAVFEGKATLRQLAKNWLGSYLGNLLGCALGVFLLLNSGLMPQFANAVNNISVGKISSPFWTTFVKAIMANWFVCLSVWQATAAQTMGGKFIACLSGISAFVAIGLEHCVANMVFIPMGILTGVPGVTWEAFFFKNLLPVTLGNIVAGTLCVATAYSLAYGSLGKKVWPPKQA